MLCIFQPMMSIHIKSTKNSCILQYLFYIIFYVLSCSISPHPKVPSVNLRRLGGFCRSALQKKTNIGYEKTLWKKPKQKGLSGILKYRFYMMKMLDCRSVDFHHVFLWFRNTEANFVEYFVFSHFNHKSLRWVLLTFLSNGKKCFPVDLPFGEKPI